MAYPEPLPSNTHAVSDVGHTTDHNTLTTAVTNIDGRLHTVELGAVRQFIAASYGFATGATAAANTAALQAAVNAANTAGGGDVLITGGTYSIDLVTHPNTNANWTKTAVALKAGVRLRGPGSNRATLKLVNAAALQAGTQNRIIINWDPDADVAVDEYLAVEGLTIDGNGANVGGTSTCNHGIQFWNARHITVRDVIVKNCRGNDTSTNETFHLDVVRCQDFLYEDCLVTTDDGGQTASGFSANYSDRGRIARCSGIGMVNGHGTTIYSSGNVSLTEYYAGDNGGKGLNIEHSWNILGDVVELGGESARTDAATLSAAYTHGQAHPNDGGLQINLTHGGGNIRLRNFNIGANTTRGVGVLGAVTGTATTGTTGSTIVASTSIFYPAMVGRHIQLAAHGWFKITGYTSATTITTESAHGGASGETILIMSGHVSFEGTISDCPTGLQFLDATAALKQLTIRSSDFTNARFARNTNDMVDVGNGSTVTVSVASGKAVATLTDNQVTGQEFPNYFPMEMLVMNVSATGITSTRGSSPKATLTSTGTSGTVDWRVPVGGSILVNNTTMSNVSWWFNR